MDPDSPMSRVERTLWAVWSYITGAVNRFLRPESISTAGDDSNQQSPDDSERAVDSGQPEDDCSGTGVNEELSLATASLISLSRPGVTWEQCTTEIDLRSEEDSIQHKIQLNGTTESKTPEKAEGERQEKTDQTGNDDAELLLLKAAEAKDVNRPEYEDEKLYFHRPGDTPGNDEYEEHVRVESLNLKDPTDDVMSINLEACGGKIGPEEENQELMTLDDEQQMNDTMKTIQKDSFKTTATENSQESFHENVTCHEADLQNLESEVHAAEFTDTEQKDVDTGVQTKTRKTDDVDGTVTDRKPQVTTYISVEEGLFHEDQEDERFSREYNKERYIETACTTISVTVKPQRETGQEISGEVKNISPGIYDGCVVVARELHSPSGKETQEGVPENNNEPGSDENTTQRILEIGCCKEIHASQLPEEVESKESESLQNRATVVDFLPMHIKSDQESTDNIKKELLQLTTSELPQEGESTTAKAVEGSQQEDEEILLSSSMKARTETLENEFVTTDASTAESQDETEELFADFKDAGLSDLRGAAGDGPETVDSLVRFMDECVKTLEDEVKKMTEESFCQESVGDPEQESNKLPALEDKVGSSVIKVMKESFMDEPKLNEDSAADMQAAGTDVKETACGVEEACQDKMQNKNELEGLNLEVESPAPNAEHQLSDEAFDVSNEATSSNEAVSDVMTTTDNMSLTSMDKMEKHVTEVDESYAEKTRGSVSGCHQVVFDDEILDLWLETALLEDPHAMQQHTGQQTDTIIKQSNEERDEMASVEMEKKKLVESASEESGLLSDTEISISTAESGLFDLSGILLQSTSTGSLEGIDDVLSESDDISKLSTEQIVTEGDLFTETELRPDSGIVSSEALLHEEITLMEPEDDTCTESEKLLKIPFLYEPDATMRAGDIADSLPELIRAEVSEQPAENYGVQIEICALDFAAQRSRIAVKNPHVRPPRDPRALLNMPSLDPTPSSGLPVKVPKGLPLGAMGIGIKLPGLGAGFPVLKKIRHEETEDTASDTVSQVPETKPEKTDTPKGDGPQQRPKWVPPTHQGFGNPLMSELKTKLRKTPKE